MVFTGWLVVRLDLSGAITILANHEPAHLQTENKGHSA
jgi:hypothetical protein